MPSDQSTWLVSVPQDGDSEGLIEEITLEEGSTIEHPIVQGLE